MRFEWDPAKAAANLRKHGVSFEEAAECFEDPLALVLEEPREPERLILIGLSRARRLVFTVYVERFPAALRIISARKATKRERREYEEGDY
ncbi:MAG: BrnT family toxin [Kofleriaceae bacterium]